MSEALSQGMHYGETLNAIKNNTLCHDISIKIQSHTMVKNKMNFIPHRPARRGFVSEAIRNAGIETNTANTLSLLVPDIFILNSIFVRKSPIHLIVVAGSAECFIQYEGHTLYLGRALDMNNQGITFASQPWRTTDILWMTDYEAMNMDIDALLNAYQPERWKHEHKRLTEAKKVFQICLSDVFKGLYGDNNMEIKNEQD